jgi:hypothetical protein
MYALIFIGYISLVYTTKEGEDYLKMDLTETGYDGTKRIDPTQDRDSWQAVTITVVKLWVSQNSGNFLTS